MAACTGTVPGRYFSRMNGLIFLASGCGIVEAARGFKGQRRPSRLED
jgi:hypothetical protein